MFKLWCGLTADYEVPEDADEMYFEFNNPEYPTPWASETYDYLFQEAFEDFYETGHYPFGI
jgi:hypothetical protein